MPEFIASGKGCSVWQSLDAFTRGYIEAALFTQEQDGDDWQAQGRLPRELGFSDIESHTLAKIIRECEAFQKLNREDLDEALDNGRINGYDEEAAGRDFWYTRNGHGVGYWDRGLGDVGDTLAEAARKCSERYWYACTREGNDSPLEELLIWQAGAEEYQPTKGAPMAYVFQAALLCEACGDHMRRVIRTPDTGDSNDYPQGPYSEGGGEADSPQHCDHCGFFLRNNLTDDGRAYVENALIEYRATKSGNVRVLKQWAEEYGFESLAPEEESAP